MADTVKKDAKWEEDVNSAKLETIELGGGFNAEEYQSIKNIVNRKLLDLEELKEKLKHINESLSNVLVNDSELSKIEEDLKKLKTDSMKRKKTLNESETVKKLQANQKEVKEEIKDIEDSLSNQLLGLYQLTGVTEFETASGEVREFGIRAKIKGKQRQ